MILTESLWYITHFFLFHVQDGTDLKRLLILYMERSNCLWQQSGLLLYVCITE